MYLRFRYTRRLGSSRSGTRLCRLRGASGSCGTCQTNDSKRRLQVYCTYRIRMAAAHGGIHPAALTPARCSMCSALHATRATIDRTRRLRTCPKDELRRKTLPYCARGNSSKWDWSPQKSLLRDIIPHQNGRAPCIAVLGSHLISSLSRRSRREPYTHDPGSLLLPHLLPRPFMSATLHISC